ncbi:uncharacterized protein N7484_000440 [Penicillium longicatenatum]|uniref:uncharacterized protein n=1 Tax=Penicillium longicatenatum TaxID=1561947 RepID=UPI002548B55B|nr:uncharacterized protein N7484_000440 [Penicillium longicatenatum]KAJ5661068.1 hypothetical protein N7484_000440 [Penicillium longicatenatum]
MTFEKTGDKGNTPVPEEGVRLRSACNNCHAAKVRCTGERSGCVRCRDSDQKCIYMVSLVGKTRGRRKRRSRIPSSCPMSVDNLDQHGSPIDAMSAWLTDANELSPERNVLPCLDDNDFLAWSGSSMSDVTLSLDNIDPAADVHDAFPSLATPEASQSPIGTCLSGITDGKRPLSSMAIHHASPCESLFRDFIALPQSTLNLAPSWSRQDNATRASTHDQTGGLVPQSRLGGDKPTDSGIASCAELVAHLEARQREGQRAVDEMLATNREAVNKVNDLIVRDGPTLSSTSSVILTAAAEHIVSLFEIIVRSKPYDQYKMPCVGFGTFLIDPEEQKALRTRIVSKELCLNTEMLRRLSRAITQRRGSMQERLKKWLQELEQRIENLISMVENE